MKAPKNCLEQGGRACCQKTKTFFRKLWQRAKRLKWWGWLLVVLALFVFLKGLGACCWDVRWHVASWQKSKSQYGNEACRIMDNYGKYDMVPISDRLAFYADKNKRYGGERGYLIDMKDDDIVDELDWVAVNGNDTLVVVAKNGKRGYMNRYTGEMVIPYKYTHAWVFSDDIAAVANDDDAVFFINREGKRVMNKVFDYHSSLQYTGYVFHYNHCVVAQAEDSVGLIDRNGEWAVKPVWRQILWRDFYWELRSEDSETGVEIIMLLDPALKPIMPATKTDKLTNASHEYQSQHAQRLPSLV